MKFVSWIVALCGLWEAGDITALFVPGFGKIHAFVWNHIMVGILLVIAGALAAQTNSTDTAKMMHWAAAAAGAWLVLASFLLGNPINAPGLWNDIIVGIIVFLLSIRVALTSRWTAN